MCKCALLHYFIYSTTIIRTRKSNMGIFSKMFGEKEKIFIEGDGGFNLEVVGESLYQKYLKKLGGGYSKEGSRSKVIAELHHENNNPNDDQAIRVDINTKPAGYLTREDARSYRKQIRKAGHEGINITCNAIVVGGKDLGLFNKTNFGIWLDLPFEALGGEV